MSFRLVKSGLEEHERGAEQYRGPRRDPFKGRNTDRVLVYVGRNLRDEHLFMSLSVGALRCFAKATGEDDPTSDRALRIWLRDPLRS